MRINSLLLSVSMILLSFSCVKEEILDENFLKSNPALPVIYCLLTPGADSIYAYVSKTIPLNQIYKADSLYIHDAKILIFSEKDTIRLFQDKNDRLRYTSGQNLLNVGAGKTYGLHFSHPDFSDIKVQTTLPVQKSNLNLVNTINEKAIDEVFGQINEYTVIFQFQPDIQKQYGYKYFDMFDLNIDYPLNSWIEMKTEGNMGFVYGYYWTTFNQTFTFPVYLATTDVNLARFNQTLKIFEHKKYTDDAGLYLEAYKGVVPEYSSVDNGVVLFGSYLLDTCQVVLFNE
jgi:hypothetical protein